MTTPSITLGILVPLKEEWDELVKSLPIKGRCTEDRDGYFFYDLDSGVPGVRLVASLLGEMGPGPANTRAGKLLTYFKPAAVVVLGIAGALDSELRLGDVVVAREVCQFQAASKVIDEKGTFQFRYAGSHWHLDARLDRMVANFSIAGAGFHQAWLQASREFRRELGLPLNPLVADETRDVLGTIASGDTVGASKAFAVELLDLNRKFLALEMEAAGAVRACHDEGVDWLIIRGLSDFSDKGKKKLDSTAGGAFRRLAARNAAEYLRQLLRWPDFLKAVNVPTVVQKGGSGGGEGITAAEGSVSVRTGALQPRPFRSVSLLQQLTTLLQAMKLPWGTIEEVFWESVPETWQDQLLEESVAEAERYQHLVNVLSKLPAQESRGRVLPLLEFVLRSRNRATASMGDLEKWLKDAAYHVGLSPAALVFQEQQIVGERHLLIKIERASSEQFLLQVWLGDARGNIQALLGEPQRCRREELPQVLGELWSSSDRRKRLGLIPDELLTVEFLLPRELLSEDVEQWRISPSHPPLGCKYRLVVRPLERVYAEVKLFLEDMTVAAGAWRTKWGLLYASTTGDDSLLWIRNPEELNEDRIQALLLRNKVISLLLTLTPPTCSESSQREVLSRAVEQGLPIALWVRLEKAAPASVDELFTLLSRDLRRLQHAVREARVDALGTLGNDKHLGRYLSLLWDDPDHRPPDSQPDDYSAPFQQGAAQ